jgi:hypothetical protein
LIGVLIDVLIDVVLVRGFDWCCIGVRGFGSWFWFVVLVRGFGSCPHEPIIEPISLGLCPHEPIIEPISFQSFHKIPT